MSTLPGNPHADEAKAMTHHANEGVNALSVSESVACSMIAAQTAATLAVAHELRTANLIAVFTHIDNMACTDLPDINTTNLADQIATRLGLGGEGQ